MSKDDAYILEIVNAAAKVARYLGPTDSARFFDEPMLQDAVMLQLAVIGEAAGKLSEQFRDSHTELPWVKIRATRNIVVHSYGQVDLDKIWTAASQGLPELVDILGPLVPPDDGSSSPSKLPPLPEL